jgi:hypothetical protein
LKAREHYGFEYSGDEDPSRMVLALELTKEEVLKHLKKILKGVSIVPQWSLSTGLTTRLLL